MSTKKSDSAIIYYHPYTQFGNLGDLVINRNLICEARKWGRVRILDKDIPVDFWEELGVLEEERQSISKIRFYFQAIMDSIAQRNRVFVFTKPGHHSPNSHLAALLPVITKSLVFIVLRMLGTQICRVGFSVDEAKTAIERISMWDIALHSYRIFRESQSMSISGSPIGQDVLGSDLGFYNKCALAPQRQVIRRIGVSMRPSHESPIDIVVKSLSGLSREDNVEIVPLYQVDSDQSYLVKIRDRLSVKNPVTRIKGDLKCYQNLDCVISNRLHVLIFALSQGCSVVPLLDSSNRKINALFRDVGLAHVIRDVNIGLSKADLYKGFVDNVEAVFDQESSKIDTAFEVVFGGKLISVKSGAHRRSGVAKSGSD